jgi:hypothetical protein
MTLDDIEKINKQFLVPTDVAPYLGVHPYSINVQAQKDPSKLGFPVIVMGSRVKIPKLAFIKFMKGEMQSCQEPK